MANEYLVRTPTSTGNRKIFTWAGWVKRATPGTRTWIFNTKNQAGTGDFFAFDFLASGDNDALRVNDSANTDDTNLKTTPSRRDPSSWMHLVLSIDTTKGIEQDRVNIYANGVQISDFTLSNYPTQNALMMVNSLNGMNIGTAIDGSGNSIYPFNGEMFDIFFIDGQALTPDVFGFYKEGKGYQSSGSTQATDFRPGQWVPKAPRTIKSEINRRGGFGVNGFYLPMNDSSNFGADFHTTPNSIITLKGENLPQPRNGAPTTTDAYVSQLREDPYKDYLVYAVPGISGGQGSGYGDYSADIKGSGTNKTVTSNGNVSVAATNSYYGSALSFYQTGDYIETPHSTDFNFGTGDFTIECWRYLDERPTVISTYLGKYDGTESGSDFFLGSWSDGKETFFYYDSSNVYQLSSPVGLSTTKQWDHIAACRKGNQLSLFVNGVCANTTTYNSSFNDNSQVVVSGYDSSGNGYQLKGRLQDIRVYKGVAKYTGGFDVPKPYTPVGIESWRAVPDCTANNFCTWNPLSASAGNSDVSFADGNLKLTSTVDSWPMRSATFGISSGKWYFESYAIDTTRFGVGWGSDNNLNTTTFTTSNANSYLFWSDNPASKYELGTKTALNGSPAFTIGDITGIAIDFDAGKIWYSINGTWTNDNSGNVGNPSNGSNPQSTFTANIEMYPNAMLNLASYSTNFGQNPTFSGNTTAGTYADSNGKGLFKYQPPSGFLALCEDNLPTPAIADPGEHFKTVLWSGDGQQGRSITGLGFQPDLVWLKTRTAIADNHKIIDTVRGATKTIYSNLTQSELTESTGLLSFDTDGFSIGSDSGNNGSGRTFVAWCWKAGGNSNTFNVDGIGYATASAAGITDGSIPLTGASVNTTAGFSIVGYEGTGGTGTATFSHGLNKTPSFVIIKNRDADSNWGISHSGLTNNNYYLLLPSAGGEGDYGSLFIDRGSSLITIDRGSSILNTSANSHIAYCWTEVEGFSKFGRFAPNANADGPFIWCGFKPAMVIMKKDIDGYNWVMHDSSRDSTNTDTFGLLFPNLNNVENRNNPRLDFLSNGFKLRESGNTNIAGGDVFFMAWAESPFQTANAK